MFDVIHYGFYTLECVGISRVLGRRVPRTGFGSAREKRVAQTRGLSRQI
jgi:hypothetical protein